MARIICQVALVSSSGQNNQGENIFFLTVQDDEDGFHDHQDRLTRDKSELLVILLEHH